MRSVLLRASGLDGLLLRFVSRECLVQLLADSALERAPDYPHVLGVRHADVPESAPYGDGYDVVVIRERLHGTSGNGLHEWSCFYE